MTLINVSWQIISRLISKHHLLSIYIIVSFLPKQNRCLLFNIRIYRVCSMMYTNACLYSRHCLAVIDNSRYDQVEFTIPTTGTMHGFAGFFEAKLYKDITISSDMTSLDDISLSFVILISGIEPNTHSKNMISWFPMFFPIRVRIDMFVFRS
jgi:type II protein arginine methyltransferase